MGTAVWATGSTQLLSQKVQIWAAAGCKKRTVTRTAQKELKKNPIIDDDETKDFIIAKEGFNRVRSAEETGRRGQKSD